MIKILAIGAHPDDCDIAAGGSAALWRRRGDEVAFVSATNGNAGHFAMTPADLALRRRREAETAAAVLGIEYEVLENDDGRLEPSLERRLEMIRLLRRHRPDLILTHRPNDYHPDHRYTSTLVQDSAYMVTVPLICPEIPHLEKDPTIAYFHDDFTRPCTFRPDVVVPVDSVMGLKWEMLHAHGSQFYEWLPFNDGTAGEVPAGSAGDSARKAWLEKRWGPRLSRVADVCRQELTRVLGPARARLVRHAEAFELSEYGGRPEESTLAALFPLPPGGP